MLTLETILQNRNDKYPRHSQWALEVIQMNLQIVMICPIIIHRTAGQVFYYFITVFQR